MTPLLQYLIVVAATLATGVLGVVAYRMYLRFCWKVYDRNGDTGALVEAAKAGRIPPRFYLGLPVLPAEVPAPEQGPPPVSGT